MKNLFYFLLMSLSWINLSAQSDLPPVLNDGLDNINLGIFNESTIISLNYEHEILSKNNFSLTTQVGIGLVEEFNLCLFDDECESQLHAGIPHRFSAVFGQQVHRFEFGYSGLYALKRYSPHAFVGYRFVPKDNKFLTFKAFVNYNFNDHNKISPVIPFGIVIGNKITWK